VSALLAVSDLVVRVKRFGWRGTGPAIIDGVSLAVGEREIVGIVGESGSGKTTLIRAIFGLVRPASGRIAIDGAALPDFCQRSYRALRRTLALVFQNPAGSFNPRLRIGTALLEATRNAPDAPDPTALLKSVGLDPALARRYPRELSGGQARRAAIARALATNPRAIVADEPTAGLDVSAQGEILNLLLDLRDRRGTSLVFVTHNLAVVRRVTDRIAVMYLGRLVETGPTDAVVAAPAHPYTRALLASEPVPDPDRRQLHKPVEGEIPSLFRRPAGCEFHPRCPLAAARCRDEAPALRPVAADRAVRCHFPLVGEAAA
jgi:peptide/nickel transport system ATP-binding protein